MPDHDSFLRAIIANPDDDDVRLVYADWLEEQGADQYAEFIRVQIRLAGWQCNDCGTSGRVINSGFEEDCACGVIWYKNREAILGSTSLPNSAKKYGPWQWCYRRGFLERVYLASQACFESLDDIQRSAPIREVRLNDIDFVPAPIFSYIQGQSPGNCLESYVDRLLSIFPLIHLWDVPVVIQSELLATVENHIGISLDYVMRQNVVYRYCLPAIDVLVRRCGDATQASIDEGRTWNAVGPHRLAVPSYLFSRGHQWRPLFGRPILWTQEPPLADDSAGITADTIQWLAPSFHRP